MRRVFGSAWLFAAAAAVVFSLVLVASPSASSAAQRAAYLEGLIKCPACQDISVAQSDATSSIAVRQEIVARVAAGESDNVIIAALESRYGDDILLSPRGSGLDDLLWIVPAVVVAGGAVVFGRLLWRRP
jgi:cytochrome c-type biogenesis protein CcmH